MIIGTVENSFIFWRQCCTSALLSVSISVPKKMLFTNANFWEVFGTADHFINFRRQCCTSALLMASTSVPKKCYSTMPTFDDFWALLNFFYFPASRLYMALVVVGTTVPNQKLFISANFWWLLAQLEVVLFFGGNGVLRRCWWLVLQCRYKGCSLVPIFDDYWHWWKFFYFLAALLYFGTVER